MAITTSGISERGDGIGGLPVQQLGTATTARAAGRRCPAPRKRAPIRGSCWHDCAGDAAGRSPRDAEMSDGRVEFLASGFPRCREVARGTYRRGAALTLTRGRRQCHVHQAVDDALVEAAIQVKGESQQFADLGWGKAKTHA